MAQDAARPGPSSSEVAKDDAVERRVRSRIRSLRTSKGWSLDELAARTLIGASTLSRIETGKRRVALDQLAPIARALGTTIDDLVDVADEEDVVIRPQRHSIRGAVVWPLTRRADGAGPTVAKMRITARRPPAELPVHPGHDWFYVLSGTAKLQLGDHVQLVRTGQAVEFSTMTPHWLGGADGPVEVLGIFDGHGERAHLHDAGGAARGTSE
jgi:transcriptional regulator with XRE-family HTH domain